MSTERYFGTYDGEIVEYQKWDEYDTALLSDGRFVYLENITPSPYPWQFHTKEFWDSHPGMRWAYPCFVQGWYLASKSPSFVEGKGFYHSTIDVKWLDGISFDGDPAASLFENPFFRTYPAELDDPAWWRDNAQDWATCASWDLVVKRRPFFFYECIPHKHNGGMMVWCASGDYLTYSPMDGRYTGTWEDCPLIMRPAAKLPMVKYLKAAPKRAGKPLSVKYAGAEGVRFFAVTEQAQNWLNEQAPMFGCLARIDARVFWLTTDFPAAAMRYLIDGFYNRQPDVIRKYYPEPESKPRVEKRTIERLIRQDSKFYFEFVGHTGRHEISFDTLTDLAKNRGLFATWQIVGKTITVRIDADKLVIVEDRE